MQLTTEDRTRLTEAATRIRSAAHQLDMACQLHRVNVPPTLTAWPSGPRRSSGWARATNSDQAEDERLLQAVADGRATAAVLEAVAPLDPTARLASWTFSNAADRYDTVSRSLHEHNRVAGMDIADTARALHMGASRLIRTVDDAAGAERWFSVTRLVPPALIIACNRMGDHLAVMGEPPDEHSDRDPVQLALTRDLEGTLGMVAALRGRLPETVLLAAAGATSRLDDWDEATGSFRDVGDIAETLAATLEERHASPQHTGAATRQLADAEAELHRQLNLTLDAVTEVARRGGGRGAPQPLQELLHLDQALTDGGRAPAHFPARDDVMRDHAARIDTTFLDLTVSFLDASEPDSVMLARAAMDVRRAARTYLDASNAVADTRRPAAASPSGIRVPREVTDTVAAAWRNACEALFDVDVSDVGVVEMTAFAQDLSWAQEENVEFASATPEPRHVIAVDRRLGDTVHSLVMGDAGSQLGLLPRGQVMLSDLEAAGRRLDHHLGVVRDWSRPVSQQRTTWLAGIENAGMDHQDRVAREEHETDRRSEIAQRIEHDIRRTPSTFW